MKRYANRGILVAAAVAVAALAAGAGAAETQPASGAPATTQPASSPTTTPAPATTPATQPTAGEHAARIGSNFLSLMGNNWADIAWFVGKVVLSAILWGALMVIAGAAAGLAAYIVCRRLGWVRAPWGWYRYVGWLWVPIFFISAACGFAYGGVWLGAGRCVKSAIRNDFVLDKVASHLILAVMMDQADYKATGQESAEQIQKVFADSEEVRRLAREDWNASAERIRDDAGESFLQRWLIDLALDQGLDEVADRLEGLDPREVHAVIFSSPNIEQYMKDHPNASPGVVMLSQQLILVRLKACALVDKTIWPSVLTGVLLGLLGPVGLCGIFRLIVWQVTKHRPAVLPPVGGNEGGLS